MYGIVRKSPDWKVSLQVWWVVWPAVIFMAVWIIMSVITVLLWGVSLGEFLKKAIFLYIYFAICITILVNGFCRSKAKKYKRNWKWIMKKLKVTAIGRTFSGWKTGTFDWYYVEAKDGNIFYCSMACDKWDVWWISIEVLENIYETYWYHFDMEEKCKQAVLRECDRRISEKEYQLDNGWALENLVVKWEIFNMKSQRKLVERGYEPQYREIDWRRITVWDSVDVYIDPKNEKNYWMDIDFLFDK